MPGCRFHHKRSTTVKQLDAGVLRIAYILKGAASVTTASMKHGFPYDLKAVLATRVC